MLATITMPVMFWTQFKVTCYLILVVFITTIDWASYSYSSIKRKNYQKFECQIANVNILSTFTFFYSHLWTGSRTVSPGIRHSNHTRLTIAGTYLLCSCVLTNFNTKNKLTSFYDITAQTLTFHVILLALLYEWS